MESEKLSLAVEVPRLDVSEYHRPYVAMWIQNEQGEAAVNLAVWYQVKGPSKDFGAKWLPELRQWWRRSGRGMESALDAITAPTPAPGEHEVKLPAKQLAGLAPGKYRLVVEAAREVGGREVVEVPFTWPAQAATTVEGHGKKELGKVTLKLKP